MGRDYHDPFVFNVIARTFSPTLALPARASEQSPNLHKGIALPLRGSQ
jgi:hypothetical protein